MKYYLIYQIRNKLNGMIYVGQHQTENIDDGYMGSGIRIRRAIEKYGLENFEKTILFECSSVEEMNAKEAELVNEDFIARDDVYNIELGGVGGWSHLSFKSKSQAAKKRWQNISDEQKKIFKKKCGIKSKQWNANVDKIEWKKKISDGLKKFYAEHPEKRNKIKGYKFSEESKKKISKRMKDPTINKMKQSRWIYNVQTLEYKIWPKDVELPVGWKYGQKPHIKVAPKNPNHPNLSYCWISKNNINKYILKIELDKWLNAGWHRGRANCKFIKK